MRRWMIVYTAVGLWATGCSQPPVEVDILIQNGTVYNGQNDRPTYQSVGIKGDRIVFMGNSDTIPLKAVKTIDATGLLVTPGFIDPHTHADRDLVNPETADNLAFLMQGVTTTIVGNDGDSFYPLSKYKKLYEEQGIGTNVVPLLGHHEVIREVIGNSDRSPTPDEMKKMQGLVQKEMDAGAFGISTGLYYAPGSYTKTEEVIALAKVAAKNGGIYDTHLRDEGSGGIGLIPAVQEAITIGEKADLPIHISHIKCLGVDVWRQSDSIIRMIEKARKRGLDVTANQYPYDASATSLNAAVSPRWAESGGRDSLLFRAKNPQTRERLLKDTKRNITRRGGPDKLLIVKCTDSLFLGKTLLDNAQALGLAPEAAVYRILETGYVRVASFNMNAHDIENFMKQEWVVTGSDGNTGHPRKYGSFPRKYHKYVKEYSIIPLSTFINGSTSKTAEMFRIPDRGVLREGYYADVILFDPETFRDKANYTDAFQFSEGLEYSIINGKLSVENGAFTQKRNGKVLKK